MLDVILVECNPCGRLKGAGRVVVCWRRQLSSLGDYEETMSIFYMANTLVEQDPPRTFNIDPVSVIVPSFN